MGSGCGTFASSSPLEGDTDYSHRPKLAVLVGKKFGNSTHTNSAWYIAILLGRRWGPLQPTNYMGGAESDIRVNIKGGAIHMNDLIVPNACLSENT